MADGSLVHLKERLRHLVHKPHGGGVIPEKDLVGTLLLMPSFNVWTSDVHLQGHIHHRDLSRTVSIESAACMPEAWRLRLDHVVPCVEGLDKALEIQRHETLGVAVTPAPRGGSCL